MTREGKKKHRIYRQHNTPSTTKREKRKENEEKQGVKVVTERQEVGVAVGEYAVVLVQGVQAEKNVTLTETGEIENRKVTVLSFTGISTPRIVEDLGTEVIETSQEYRKKWLPSVL